MTRARFWTGAGLVLLAAMLFSGTSISAVFSYRSGGNPAAVMAVRFSGAIVILGLLLWATGTPLGLPRRQRLIALGIGVPQAAQSYFLYNAFEVIPIGLTMIVFYIYPLLVGVMASAIGQDRMTRSLAAGLGIAFIGVLLVLDVTGKGLDFTGALLALGAALSWTLVIVLTGWVAPGQDPRRVTLHAQFSAFAIMMLAVAAGMEVKFPETTAGWTAIVLLPLFYGGAVTIFFVAASMIGPVRASLIMNVEVLLSVVLGYLILAQSLTPMQLAGGAFIMLALFAARRESPLAPANTKI